MKKKYRARCHCGNIRFEFLDEEIKEGRRCNCSLCLRRGIILSVKYIPPEEFKILSDPVHQSVYLWNDRVVDNVFCNNCGIHTFFGSPEYGYRINLGCVEEIDAFALPTKSIDGRSMAIAENPGPHPGE